MVVAIPNGPDTVGNWPLASDLLDISGNGYDLTPIGTAYHSRLFQESGEPLGCVVFDGSFHMSRAAGTIPNLLLTGAMSFMCFRSIATRTGAEDLFIRVGGGAPDTEPNNALYQFSTVNAFNNDRSFWERSGALDVTQVYSSGQPVGGADFWAITRSAGGVVTIYQNDAQVDQVGPLQLPVNGINSILWLGFAGLQPKGAIASVRIDSSERTPEEVAAIYEATGHAALAFAA